MPFLINDTRRGLYRDAATDRNEDSARALALKVLEVAFSDEKYFRNSELYLKDSNGNTFRPDLTVLESVPAGQGIRKGIVVVCDEVKPAHQTESQDNAADAKMAKYGEASLQKTPGQKLCFPMRHTGTTMRFWIYSRSEGLKHWSKDYLDVDKDWNKIQTHFRQMQTQALF